jgi:transcription initiation factor TFIIIB Brf1 subunit/transcription initiation factor TFIIB
MSLTEENELFIGPDRVNSSRSFPVKKNVSSRVQAVARKSSPKSASHSKIDDIDIDKEIEMLFDIAQQTNNMIKNNEDKVSSNSGLGHGNNGSELLNKKISKKNKKSENEENKCSHEDTINENGIDVCINCGIALYDKINNEAEWRYYGDNDNQHSIDPSRCQYRKGQERGIQNELIALGFPHQIVEISDKLYNKATQGDIKRSNLRKGIMLACVFQAYMNINKPQTTEKLQEIFGIERKVVTGGINYFRKKVPKEDIKISYITAEHFIPDILDTFNINKEHTNNILELYKNIETKGNLIDRRNPQSVGKGLVYYYLKKMNVDISPAKFGKLTKLSESTLINIVNEIDSIL